MGEPSTVATNLPEALKQIEKLTSDIATEKKRSEAVKEEGRLRLSLWKEAHSHLSELHENRKQDDLNKLQDTKRVCDELRKEIMLMSNDHHHKIQELKSQNDINEEEISDLAATILDLRREKSNAMHLAEQSELRIKNLQRRLDASYKYTERGGRKRGLSDADDEHRDAAFALVDDNKDGTTNTAKKARLAPPKVVVPCTQCYTKGWKCDNGDGGGSCRNCQLRQKSAVCKRVMCKNYDGDKCKDRKCTFAHENDCFHHVVNYTILKVIRQGKSPVEREAEKGKDDK